jgi:predicted NBD/HSP70 family sugar kinase
MDLLFDIGATTMRVAVSRDGKEVGDLFTAPTPQEFGPAMDQFGELTKKAAGTAKINCVAGGVPGTLNEAKNKMLRPGNLPLWANQPFVESISKITGAPVRLENDAALVGLGEAVYGAGKDCRIVAYLTVSTGVGGARIINKKIDHAAYNFEPGYQIINFDRVEGHVQSLGQLISGTSLKQKYGQRPSEITDPAVWAEVEYMLAIGIHNTIIYWSPDIVVLGGGVITRTQLSLANVEEYLHGMPKAFPVMPKISKVALDEKSGLYGALAYLRSL